MEEQVLETGGKKMREELTKGKVHRKYTSERKYSFPLRGSDYPKWKTIHMMDTDDRNCIADGLAMAFSSGNISFPDDWEIGR